MGCGSSNTEEQRSERSEIPDNNEITDSDCIDILVEPKTDPSDFPYVLGDYPRPGPSKLKKAHFFSVTKYATIDKRAKNTENIAGNSFEELFKHLFQGMKDDLEKVRAIFSWIGYKNAKESEGGPVNSPNSILHQVQKGKMSFAYMFARFCREGNIPCVIITGLAKSVGYEVGDKEDKVSHLTNRWNAVYVKGEWRIVFPLWAFKAVVGHKAGKFILVETKGKAVRQKEQQSEGEDIVRFNEYYFLTDPDDFVNVAMASDPDWQLIARPYDLKKFCDIPYLRQHYFKREIEIIKGLKSCLHSESGEIKVDFKAFQKEWGGYLSYELYFNEDESKSVLPSDLQLDKYVLMERQMEQWLFHVMCPVTGVYKLQVNVGTLTDEEFWLCSFKLFCNEVKADNQPLPCNTGSIGWGPSNDTVKAGLTAPSQTKGIINVSSRKEVYFRFTMIRMVAVRTVLVNNKVSTEELQSHVSQTIDEQSKKLNVTVNVPEDGDYALQIHAKDKNSKRERNACNYLISKKTKPAPTPKKKKRENVTERKARSSMKESARGKDLEKLTKDIEKFQKLSLDDKGDLEVALNRQTYLSLRKDLNDSIKRRHIKVLDTAIQNAEKSKFREPLKPKIEEAEEVRDELKRLNRFAHDILEMKQPTVSELHSYKIPPEPVMIVMMSTFLLLGEPKENIEDWEDLQTLLRSLGRKSLISRVRQFPQARIKEVTPKLAKNIQNMLNYYDEDTVRLCSPAAGTFYVWANNVVADIIDKGNKRNRQNNQED